jgi:hypothetical protein
MSLEIIHAGLWQIAILAFLIFIGLLLKGRRNYQSPHESLYCQDRLLPDRLTLFRQRQPYATFRRVFRHRIH